MFHRFGQAKFAYGSQVSGSSQFRLLPQLPEKTKLALKVVKINKKVIISRHESKSVTHTVGATHAGDSRQTALKAASHYKFKAKLF